MTSAARSLGAFRARVRTVPLQSRSNASHFWIMLLLVRRETGRELG